MIFMLNYEKIEKDTYEKLWKSLHGKTIKDTNHYSSKIPSRAIQPFFGFLKKHDVEGPVLDIGCGNGRHTSLFARLGFDSYGIDISSWAVKAAKEKAKQEKLKINYQVGSALKLPYQKNFFNIIIDFGCLHHLRKSQWKKYKHNISRVLKSGGIFLLYGFSINSAGRVAKFCPKNKNKNWTLRGRHYNHFFDSREVCDFFGDKFEVIKEYEIGDDRPPLLFKTFYFKKLTNKE